MTQFTPRSFSLKKEVQGFYMRLPSQLLTPPGFQATHIPKGNLVLLYTKWTFFRNSSFFSFGRGSFIVLPAAGLLSCFLLRGPQGGRVDSTVQAFARVGLRGPFS